MNIKSFLFGTTQHPLYTDIGLLLIRLFAGLSLAFSHGIGKVPPSQGLEELVEGLGFPLPGISAWIAGLSEFLGGILIALGLLTRPAALFVFVTMIVAAFGVHGADPFGKKEFALLYAFIALLLFLSSAGRFSADSRIN